MLMMNKSFILTKEEKMAELVKKNKKAQTPKEKLTAPKKIKILFTIVERRKVDFYLDVLEGYEVNLQTVFYGK